MHYYSISTLYFSQALCSNSDDRVHSHGEIYNILSDIYI